MMRKIFGSSAKIRKWECFMELQRSLMKILKRRGPRTQPCGTPDVTLERLGESIRHTDPRDPVG
jgi:hypothetical protein